MKSTTTTATTSWPMRSSIGICLLLALLAIGQIKQAAGIECECMMNIVLVEPETTRNFKETFGRNDASVWFPGNGFGNEDDWKAALEAYFNSRPDSTPTIARELVKSAARLPTWPGCSNGTCRIEKNDSVWHTMERVQFGPKRQILFRDLAVNDSYRPACVKAHVRPPIFSIPGNLIPQPFQFIGCGIEAPLGTFDWLDSIRSEDGCAKTVDGQYGTGVFCVLQVNGDYNTSRTTTPGPTTIPASTTPENKTTTTSPEPTSATDATTSATTLRSTTTSKAVKGAKEPVVAMVAAILLSLAATRLLPTTVETG